MAQSDTTPPNERQKSASQRDAANPNVVQQTEASKQLDDSDENNVIENIVVYAQKRPQDIKNVSVAVSVLSGDVYEQLSLKDTTQLSAQLPNVKITANTGEGAPPVLNIRGVGSLDYNNTTTAPVAFYVDNVVGGALSNSGVYLFDIDRVEVLKGPQGTLFGRNTTGGAILISSKQPTWETEGFVNVGLANQNHSKIEGVFNTPVSDNTAIRIGISHQDYDYSSKNLEPGFPQAGMRQNYFRFMLKHETDNLDMLLKFYAEDWDGGVKPVRSKGYIADVATGEQCPPEIAGTTACTDNFGFNVGTNNFHDVRLDDNSPHSTEREGVSLELKYDIDDKTSLTSISSFNQLDRIHTFNCDASPSRLCDGDLGVDSRVLTQELRLNKELGEHYLIAGAFFIDEQIEQLNQIDLFYDFRAFTAQGPAHFFYDNDVDTQSVAVFGQLDYKLNDHFTLTAGLRFTSEETKYLATSQVNVPTEPGDFEGILVPQWNYPGEISEDAFSGKLALVHKLTPKVSLYYSVNQGYKSAGYNGSLAFTAEEALEADYGAETLTAWEIGSKANYGDLSVNAAAFYYDYQDQQVFMNLQSSQPLSAPAQVLDNVGESTIYGAELDFKYTPDNYWLLQFGLGYLPEANLKEFVDLAGNRVEDNRLPFSSEWNINGVVNYQTDIGSGNLRVQLDFDFQSEFYFDQNQNPLSKQNSHTLWNGNLTYSVTDWQFVLWGKNLTNEEYSQINFDMGAAFGLLQDLKGEASRYGLDVRYNF